MPSTALFVLLVFSLIAFFAARSKAFAVAGDHIGELHSRPIYHGAYTTLTILVPGIIFWLLWNFIATRWISASISSQFSETLSSLTLPQQEGFIRDVMTLASGGVATFVDETKITAAQMVAEIRSRQLWIGGSILAALSVVCCWFAYTRITLKMRARHRVEQLIRIMLIVCSVVAILTTLGIVFSLIFESVRFFGRVSFLDFLFGLHWSPQSAFEGAGSEAISADNSKVFGAIPLFAGTLLITFIAMCVAAPVGLMSAIYLSDYASQGFRRIAKPVLEVLAGVPTVVYGFFAALTVAPAIRGWGESIGLDVSSESALAAGLVMGIMIIPFVSSLSDDVINAVPQSLRDGSAGLGATKSETIRKVVLPAALPGIVSAMLLAVSRAVGETMIVVMAAGLAANLTINPLEAVTTVTVQIVTLLVGDQEFDSAKTLAAFALGLILFFITLALNIVALRVVQKYREQYD